MFRGMPFCGCFLFFDYCFYFWFVLVLSLDEINYYYYFIQVLNVFLSDINECLGVDNPCSKNAECTNSDGSVHCACTEGYQGNGINCDGA